MGLASLCHRRVVSNSMFAFDLLTNKIKCSELLQEVLLSVNLHGFNAPSERCLRNFSKFDENFDFNLS